MPLAASRAIVLLSKSTTATLRVHSAALHYYLQLQLFTIDTVLTISTGATGKRLLSLPHLLLSLPSLLRPHVRYYCNLLFPIGAIDCNAILLLTAFCCHHFSIRQCSSVLALRAVRVISQTRLEIALPLAAVVATYIGVLHIHL